MEKLLVVDGNSMLNRGFYGLSGNNMLRTKDGIFTNAIYGFLGILQKVLKEQNPEYICVTFDLAKPTFRHKMYDGYKANRKGMPEELAMQLPYMKQVLSAMNIHIIEKEGFEADDVIGTIAKREKEDFKVYILTGDKDSFQLVEDNINVLLPHTVKGQTTMEVITEDVIKEKYGLKPKQMIDVKALMGDNSDNIPGVMGIGEKTALSLINKFCNIEKLYEYIENNPDQVEIKGKQLEKLARDKENAFLSKKLGTIITDVDIEYTKEDIKREEYKYNELYELLKKLELKSYIEKFNLLSYINGDIKDEITNQTEENTSVYIEVNNNVQMQELVEKIQKTKKVIYYFTEKERYSFDDVKKFVFHTNNTTYSIDKSNITKEEFVSYFKQIFENDEIDKIGFDTKKDCIMLKNIGIDFSKIYFDIYVAACVIELNNNKSNIKNIILEYTGIKVEENVEKNEQLTFDLGFGTAEKEEKTDYYNSLCFGMKMLTKTLIQNLKEYNEHEMFNNIEMPLIPVLANMEMEGISVDKEVLERLNKDLTIKIAEVEKEIYDMVGEEFNISSHKQLGEILFEKLKLPIIKKNKTGYSTDGDVLEEIIGEHPVVEKILQHRLYTKFKTTYIDGLRQYIIDNRIHTKLLQTATATGRLSSVEPNLQNIPVRDEYGKNFRKMFVPKEGCILLDADYSQIELRVLAHLANDTVMIDAFNQDVDIHTLTAMRVFKLKEHEVTSEYRTLAKAVNFGIVYGISDYGLAKNIGKGVRESGEYIERYFKRYGDIKEYLNNIVRFAKENGYSETMFHRRRYIPEIYSGNFNIKKFGQRVAMNNAIQGSAAEIMKIAMINIANELKQKRLKSKLVLQIHDELLIETYQDEMEVVKEILKTGMENAVKLNVPLKVEVKEGNSWYETK